MKSLELRSLARVACLLFVALLFSACAGGKGAQEEKPQLLVTAGTNCLAAKYEQAVINYTDFLATDPKPELKAEGYVGRGNAYMALTKPDLAEADYRAAYALTRDRAMRAQAMVGMANSIFAEERFDASEKVARDLLRSYQGLIQQDEVTYRLGLSLVRQGKWDEGADLLEQVAAKWPVGEFAKAAEAKLPAVREKFFTVQIGVFTNQQMAENVLKDLKAKGFAGSLEPISIKGVPGYAVRAGKFSSWQAVSEHADKIKNAGFSTYRLP